MVMQGYCRVDEGLSRDVVKPADADLLRGQAAEDGEGHFSLAGGEAKRRQDIAAIREPARLDQHEIPDTTIGVPEVFGPETIDLAPLGIDHVDQSDRRDGARSALATVSERGSGRLAPP